MTSSTIYILTMLKFKDSKANYKFPKVVYYLSNQKSGKKNYVTRTLLHFENIFHIYTIPTKISSFSIADYSPGK